MRKGKINSRQKGARGERQWRDELRAQGFPARRGQQFSGSPDSPDVVCDELGWAHFEVKAVEKLNLEDAMDQARRDAGRKRPLVAHKRNFRPWLVTMEAETFFQLLRGDFSSTTDGGHTRSAALAESAVNHGNTNNGHGKADENSPVADGVLEGRQVRNENLSDLGHQKKGTNEKEPADCQVNQQFFHVQEHSQADRTPEEKTAARERGEVEI